MLIPTNNSHIASVYNATEAMTFISTNSTQSLHSPDLSHFENTFLASQKKFDNIDACDIEEAYDKMKFQEFAYKNDTIKTTILSHCRKIWLQIKSSTLSAILPLPGEIKINTNKTDKIRTQKENIIDNIYTDIDEEHNILGVIYPLLSSSNFDKTDKDNYKLSIGFTEYNLSNIDQKKTVTALEKKINMQKPTMLCKYSDYKSKYKMVDINPILYNHNRIILSYSLARDNKIEIKKNFIVSVNRNDLSSGTCSTFHNSGARLILPKINKAAIVKGCGKNNKLLVAINIEKDTNDQHSSLQLCNSRINANGNINPCYYDNTFYDEHFNKDGGKEACDSDTGAYSANNKFYVTRNQPLRAANLGKIGDHVVMLYALHNTMHSYIVNSQTKILSHTESDEAGGNYYVIKDTQQLLSISDNNITQVHVGQVPEMDNHLYACSLDSNNTLHCIYGEIVLQDPPIIKDHQKIYNSTVIKTVTSLEIYGVTREVFANNTIDELYRQALPTTTPPTTIIATEATTTVIPTKEITTKSTTARKSTPRRTLASTSTTPSKTIIATEATTTVIPTEEITTKSTTARKSTHRHTLAATTSTVPSTTASITTQSTSQPSNTTETSGSTEAIAYTTAADKTTVMKNFTDQTTATGQEVTNVSAPQPLIRRSQSTQVNTTPQQLYLAAPPNVAQIAWPTSFATVLFSLCAGYIFYRRRKNRTVVINSIDQPQTMNLLLLCCIRCIRSHIVNPTQENQSFHNNQAYDGDSLDSSSSEEAIFDRQNPTDVTTSNTLPMQDNPSSYVTIDLQAVDQGQKAETSI